MEGSLTLVHKKWGLKKQNTCHVILTDNELVVYKSHSLEEPFRRFDIRYAKLEIREGLQFRLVFPGKVAKFITSDEESHTRWTSMLSSVLNKGSPPSGKKSSSRMLLLRRLSKRKTHSGGDPVVLETNPPDRGTDMLLRQVVVVCNVLLLLYITLPLYYVAFSVLFLLFAALERCSWESKKSSRLLFANENQNSLLLSFVFVGVSYFPFWVLEFVFHLIKLAHEHEVNAMNTYYDHNPMTEFMKRHPISVLPMISLLLSFGAISSKYSVLRAGWLLVLFTSGFVVAVMQLHYSVVNYLLQNRMYQWHLRGLVPSALLAALSMKALNLFLNRDSTIPLERVVKIGCSGLVLAFIPSMLHHSVICVLDGEYALSLGIGLLAIALLDLWFFCTRSLIVGGGGIASFYAETRNVFDALFWKWLLSGARDMIMMVLSEKVFVSFTFQTVTVMALSLHSILDLFWFDGVIRGQGIGWIVFCCFRFLVYMSNLLWASGHFYRLFSGHPLFLVYDSAIVPILNLVPKIARYIKEKNEILFGFIVLKILAPLWKHLCIAFSIVIAKVKIVVVSLSTKIKQMVLVPLEASIKQHFVNPLSRIIASISRVLKWISKGVLAMVQRSSNSIANIGKGFIVLLGRVARIPLVGKIFNISNLSIIVGCYNQFLFGQFLVNNYRTLRFFDIVGVLLGIFSLASICISIFQVSSLVSLVPQRTFLKYVDFGASRFFSNGCMVLLKDGVFLLYVRPFRIIWHGPYWAFFTSIMALASLYAFDQFDVAKYIPVINIGSYQFGRLPPYTGYFLWFASISCSKLNTQMRIKFLFYLILLTFSFNFFVVTTFASVFLRLFLYLCWVVGHFFHKRSNVFTPATLADKFKYNQTLCSICLMDYEPNSRLRLLPCHHNFHSECIETWKSRSNLCPICREPSDGGKF